MLGNASQCGLPRRVTPCFIDNSQSPFFYSPKSFVTPNLNPMLRALTMPRGMPGNFPTTVRFSGANALHETLGAAISR